MPKPKAIQVCRVRRVLVFWLLVWHFMANGTSINFDASHHAVVNLLGVDTCQAHDHPCGSCKSKVPDLLFHPVLVLRPFCSNLYTQGGCATLATLQMYCKECHEPPWSEKKVVYSTWCCLIFGWNSSFASFTIQCPERYRCSLLRSFADWTNWTRLPCVHSLSNSVCQGPVCSSYIKVFSMFSLARATWRGALAISDMSHNNCDRMECRWDLYPLMWRIQKRRQRCRRRLLKSAPSQCEWVCAWACAFARLPLHSSLLGGLKSRGLLASFSVNRLLSLWRKWWIMWTLKFSSQKIVCFGCLLVCTGVVKWQCM